MNRGCRQRGFSVIDVLAGVAVGGVLFSLLLPGALRGREAARLVECKDRLRMIALATHNFHDAFMRLPPGTLNYLDPPDGLDAAQKTPELSQQDCQNLSALFLILPFAGVEEDGNNGQNIYDSVDGRLANLKLDLREIVDDSRPARRVFNSQFEYGPGAGAHYPEGSGIQNLFDPMDSECVAGITISEFLCPADTLNSESDLPSVVVTMPFFNSTSFYSTPLDDLLYVVSRDKELAQTSYVAVAGTTSCADVKSPLAKWSGGMTGRRPITLEMVSNLDGTSKTFMYGESLGDVGGISKILESGQVYGPCGEAIAPGNRTIARSWLWGGLGTLSPYNFPWGTMQHPDVMDPDGEGVYLKLLGNGRLADPGAFSATHDRGVNFAMMDASVHTVSRWIRWQLYYGNGGLRDGTTERGF